MTAKSKASCEALLSLRVDTVNPSKPKYAMATPHTPPSSARASASIITDATTGAAPRASFGFRQASGDAVWDLLRRGEVDLAAGRYEGLPGTDFATTLLFEDRYCVVVREGHRHAGNAISYDEYRAQGHVFAYANSELAAWEAHVDYGGLRADALVPHWLTALSMAAASDSIATCPRRLAERMAAPLGLRIVDAAFLETDIRVYAAWRRHYDDAGIDWLRRRLADALA